MLLAAQHKKTIKPDQCLLQDTLTAPTRKKVILAPAIGCVRVALQCKIDNISKTLGLKPQPPTTLLTDSRPMRRAIDPAIGCALLTGDNLTHLADMAITNNNTVNFCYVDPPYNTGSKFLYDDTRKSSSVGVFGKHSAWMAFMLPRLVAAKEVMRNDGAIAISIDDYEHPYLMLLLNQVFGEENFIGNIIVCRSKNGKGSKKNVATNHEYLVVYGKSKATTLPGTPDNESNYNKQDEHGRYRLDGLLRKKGEDSLRSDRPNLFFPLYYDENGQVYVDEAPGLRVAHPCDSAQIDRRWTWSKETVRANSWKLYASKNGAIYIKNYSSPAKKIKLRTWWDSSTYYTERATAEIKKIYGDKVFDTPKPVAYIKDIINQMSAPDAIIIDFFAGSGTTAHAVFELNKADGGSRKIILMESDAVIPEKHIARAHGFTLLSDITKYRLQYLKDLDGDFDFEVIGAQEAANIAI